MRKLLSGMLAVFLLASGLTAVAEDAAPEGYRCSRIAFFDQTGTELDSFTGGGQVTGKVRVKAEADLGELFFAVLVYQDQKLISAGCDNKAAAKGVTEYSAQVALPASDQGVEVNAVLWDSVKGMEPVCNAALSPGGSPDLECLYLNGSRVADFDPDVTDYHIPGSREMREIVLDYRAKDNGAKVTVTPGADAFSPTEIQVRTLDGQTKTYRILVDDVALAGNVRFGPKVPIETPAGTDPIPVANYLRNMQNGQYTFSDRTAMTNTNLPPELQGQDWIQTGLNWQNGNAEVFPYCVAYHLKPGDPNFVDDWTLVDLYRSATLEVYTIGDAGLDYRTSHGWTDQGTGQYFSYLYSGSDRWFTRKLTKHFEVEEGETLVTASLPPEDIWIAVIRYDGYPVRDLNADPDLQF